jgi:hypothetical protein
MMKGKHYMRSLLLGCLLLVLPGISSIGTDEHKTPQEQSGQQSEEDMRRTLDLEIRHTIDVLRELSLIQELELPEDRATHILKKMQDARQIRKAYLINRSHIEDQLGVLLYASPPDQSKITELILELDAMKTQYYQDLLRTDKELRMMLSPEEQAKYVLFQKKFHQQLQEIIARIRQQRSHTSPPSNVLIRKQEQESVIRQP